MGFQGLLNLSFCFLKWKWPWSLCCFRSTSFICLEELVFLLFVFFYCRLNKYIKNGNCLLCFFQCRKCNSTFTYTFKNSLKRKTRGSASETLKAKRRKWDCIYKLDCCCLLQLRPSWGNPWPASPCLPSKKKNKLKIENSCLLQKTLKHDLVGDFHIYTFLTKLTLKQKLVSVVFYWQSQST